MSFSEPFWEDLLQFIDERQVIPIIGPELLQIQRDGKTVLLDRYLAQRLGERLAIPTDDLPEEGPLNHVICRYLHQSASNRRERIYSQLRLILNDLHLPVPEPLRRLAKIRHFNLYVSMTFDRLLRQALAEERGEEPEVIVYTPSAGEVRDLRCEASGLTRPTVFQLMGQIASTPDYTVTEEDTLEFLYAMHSGKRPNLLFDELRSHHLLLIGCSYPDWLARFFIRLTKGARLSGPRDWQEIVADRAVERDRNLTLFLEHFSYATHVFDGGGAVAFVDELTRRYLERHPTPAGEAEEDAPARPSRLPEIVPGSIFLSYAREDLPAVVRICESLKEIGCDVWLDKSDLQGGEAWDREIQRRLRLCSLFLPVISENTQARDEGYFRREWRWAAERALGMADSVPFIVPLVLDDVPIEDARAPDLFREKQSFRLPRSGFTAAFQKRMIELVRSVRKRERRLV